MNKKITFSIVGLVALILIGFFSVNYFYDYQAKKIASETENYLINEEDKKKEDIKEVKGIRSKVGDYGILVRVIYKSEPNIHYFYISNNGKIMFEGKEDLSKAKDPVLNKNE
ncbi:MULTISPECIES: DUF3139 domain-containing protein [Bacillus]|uniref:DUF3139 domain-containing protein n=1 Tax=Bacillus TaxID=1386 RepID=UPI0021116CAC|nr:MULTISPECIES: DUF3139 domain-containing protein [Bacillus]MED1748510.1 DUF3139 domain-containing protein [Bacillus zhangzhouensis]UUD43222.1 DUF3139 domain-containing protein [Bacillus pumilus]